MRKFFEGHSLTGVVIIFSAFALAVLLRFFDLSDQSPWTDEIASWWYLRHLDTVFYRESHSPLFYGILRFFLGPDATISAIRYFVASVSVIHLIEFFFLGQLALSKRAFLIFWVFVCLNPADIVHARMARHYSWLLEGMLVYFLLWKIGSKQWLRILVGTFTAYIHIFAVIPIAVMGAYDFYRERKWRDFLLSLVPCFLAGIYYLARIVTLGSAKVVSNIWWVKTTLFTFLSSITTQFLGDSFPRFEFYPVSPWLAAIVVGGSGLFLIYKRKPSAMVFILIGAASIITIEALIPWANFRVNRYVIYLSGIWLFALADSLENVKSYIYYPVLALPLIYLVSFNPLFNYSWENERVELWKAFQLTYKTPQRLVCANEYQNEYYGLEGDCVKRVKAVDVTKPLLFFDLNATQTFVTAPFLKTMKVTDYMAPDYGGVFVKFDPLIADVRPVKKKRRRK